MSLEVRSSEPHHCHQHFCGIWIYRSKYTKQEDVTNSHGGRHILFLPRVALGDHGKRFNIVVPVQMSPSKTNLKFTEEKPSFSYKHKTHKM
jgi:hypothetical protein